MVQVRDGGRTPPNRIADFNRAFDAALEDGEVSRGEARKLARMVRRDGISGREQVRVREAVNEHRDQFARGADDALWAASFIGNFNSTDLLDNAATVARADDGRIGAAEARRIIDISKEAGFTRAEHRELEQTLRQERLNGPGRRVLERYVEDTRTLPPRTKPETIKIAGVPVRTHGASKEAIDELKRTLPAMLENNPELRRKLKNANFEISIIPANKKMTDLPELRHLRDQTPAVGGEYDAFRGVSTEKNGKTIVGIPEEGLARLPTRRWRKEYSLAVHEIAHAAQDLGFTDKQERELNAIFAERTRENGPFPSSYARENAHEFFAEASTAYFGRGPTADRDAAWLRRRDPKLYNLLREIYGPPQAL